METWKRNVLYGVIVFGLLLRIFYATISVDVADHYLNLMTAKSMRECWCVPVYDMYGTAPLYRPPASHFWLALFMPYPKIGSLLFGMVLVLVTYLLSMRLGLDASKALFATALVSVTPIAVSFSSTNSLDVFAGVYLVLALLFLLSGWIVLSSLFTALGFLSKYDAGVFILVPLCYLVWKKQWKQLGLYVLILVLIVSPWFIRMGSVFGNPFYPYLEPLFGHYGTSEVGHHVPLYHYLLGLPLTLFGVPEGDYRTALTIASGMGIPSVLVWLGYFVMTLLIGVVLYGVWKFVGGLTKDHRMIVGLTIAWYGLFFLVRVFVPIGSDVLDLRYALMLIPLFALGVTYLDQRTQWTILVVFLIGSVGLYGRFALAAHGFEPYADALEFAKTLPLDAVVLFDNDHSVYSYGIMYHTGRLSFPYLDGRATSYHIPFRKERYEEIKLSGPNYLWTTDATLDCGTNLVFKNSVIGICSLVQK